jgi:anti-anti-sigma factor
MDMELRRALIGHRQVLIVTGDIDLVSLPRFNDALVKFIGEYPSETVVVDVDGAGLIEDAALGLLLGTAGRARQAQGDVIVVATETRLRTRLAITGFDRAVTVANSISGS